jgi:hypothetical protein
VRGRRLRSGALLQLAAIKDRASPKVKLGPLTARLR